MWRVGEHIHGLYSGHTVVNVEVVQIASLCGGIARHIDNALWCSAKNGLHHIRVHTSTRRVGDDDVRATVFGDEVVGENIFHIACKEQRVVDMIDLRVYLSVFDSLWHVLNANDLTGLLCYEIGNRACAGIKVVNQR